MNWLNRRSPSLSVFLVGCMLLLSGCENGNLFGGLNDRGDSSSAEDTLVDAENSFREKDYQRSLDLFNRILTQDPDNSVALRGAAAAELALTGLNVGTIVANLLDQVGSASVSNAATSNVSGLGDFIAASREVISVNNATDSRSIVFGIDISPVLDRIDRVVCQLKTIVSNSADGVIPFNDIDTLLNLASLCIIRPVLRGIRNNFFDLRNDGTTNYDVINLGTTAAICTDVNNRAVLLEITRDLVAAYALITRVVSQLGLSGNQIIVQLQADIQEAAEEYLSTTNPRLPTECLNLFANPPDGGDSITAANFTSNTTVFSDDPGVCS